MRTHCDRDPRSLLAANHSLNSCLLHGLDGRRVEIQARAVEVLNNPKPFTKAVKVIGMAKGAVTESLKRISGALVSIGIAQSEVQILVNLAPADIPKDGTSLDLPLAICILQAAGYLPDLPDHKQGDFLLFGEVGIHGDVRSVRGALSLAFSIRGGQNLICPTANAHECALILAKEEYQGCAIYPVSTLEELMQFFAGERTLEPAAREPVRYQSVGHEAIDFGRIRGQEAAREAALICAAGGHNLLLIGPPGEGKSLIASAIPGILPALSRAEKVELTRIHSACGKLGGDATAVTRRPMRVVHHSASQTALVGGGSPHAKPGEITLAHMGILFLDELPEFPRSSLEALRQPIEQGWVTISRAAGSLRFPSRFTLVAAMNPCPCGYYGSSRCRCGPQTVNRYLSRLSGPLLDRIDLQVELKPLGVEARFAAPIQGVSAKMRAMVQQARDTQSQRYQGTSVPHNAAMPGGHIEEYSAFSEAGWYHYRSMVSQQQISTRSMDRLAKVSRTVADLRRAAEVGPDHIDTAAKYVVGGLLRDRH